MHPKYQMELMVAHFVPSGNALPYSYYFVDMSMNFVPEALVGQCYEGVWGRTSCIFSSSVAPVPEEYDLNGDIFAVQYKKSQFVAL